VDVEGERGGFAVVDRATTNLPSAVDGADVIIVVTGGNSRAVMARSLAPLVRDGQVILLIQGNTGGSLIVRRALDDAGCRADVDVAEMDNYPYSCWRLSPTRIRPIVRKRWLQIATFPGNRIGAVFPRRSPLLPEAVAAPNILYTGFTNANAMLHVANCVANAGRIESGDSYKFYADGVTPAVAHLYEGINAERVAVAAALGASVPTLADWFERVTVFVASRRADTAARHSSRPASSSRTTAMGPIRRRERRSRSTTNSSPKTCRPALSR